MMKLSVRLRFKMEIVLPIHIDIGCLQHYVNPMARKSAGKPCAQQELFRRGGKRRGAGRKPTGERAGEQHAARPKFKASHPLHVVMRVVPGVGSLRRRPMYKAIREATIIAALRANPVINSVERARG